MYDLTSLKFLRTFAIGAGPTDAVDESDGAMVTNVPLGNEDATNFKFTRWEDVAQPLGLEIDTVAGDPREP